MTPTTSTTSTPHPAQPLVTLVQDLAPPAWTAALPAGEFALTTVRVADVPDLTPPEFERRAFDAYAQIAEAISRTDCRHAVRFWNHIPFILDPADAGRDTYMVFNAGRFRAFSDWFGGPARFERDVATASAVGHCGRDLVIHCLSATTPGRAVNNPRQVAPYHYSQRFGPLPPCFARATRATRLGGKADLLLVGGTASVRGEDSVHIDDLGAQLRETFVNMAALIGAACDKRLTPGTRLTRWLSAYRELRIYCPNRKHIPEIESAVLTRFPNLRAVEFLPADLCRPELLVEIEALAELTLPPSASFPASPAD